MLTRVRIDLIWGSNRKMGLTIEDKSKSAAVGDQFFADLAAQPQHVNIQHVVHLGLLGCPSAIAWLVVAFNADSIDRVRR
jgi:hypothetical protein